MELLVFVGYVRERETVPASHFQKNSLTKVYASYQGAAPCLLSKWLVSASASAARFTAAASLEHLPSGFVICVVVKWSVWELNGSAVSQSVSVLWWGWWRDGGL